MNKISVKFVLLILVIPLFSSCSLFGDSSNSSNDGSLTGVLIEQKADDEFEGTHLLVVDDGTQLPLKSLTLDLSGPKYLNNKVLLSGEYDGDIFSVAGLSVLEILSDADVSEPKLIDYLNSDFGLSIMYYDNWEVSENESSISFLNPDGHESIVIEQFPFSYESSVFDSDKIDTPLSYYVSLNYPEIIDLKPLMRELGPGFLDAVEIEGDDGEIFYFIYRNGLMYKVGFYPLAADLNELRIFNEMLAEFDFVGFTVEVGDAGGGGYEIGAYIPDPSELPSDVAVPKSDVDFTYFESLPFSFKAKYPASWFYAGESNTGAGVLRHYGFSDESVTADNEIISLDIVSGALPAGPSIKLAGFDGIRTVDGSTVNIFVNVDGQVYKFSSSTDKEDLIKIMASSIEHIEIE